MAADLLTEFPVWALLPKRETGVTTFLNKYPDYDGRGIKIAIFDSGIDPGAPGLKITTDGKPKIIDMVDASGAGDVDTKKTVAATNGTIVGLSGRTLRIPSSWSNPTGKYHIGIKPAFELYPKALKERIQSERKELIWDPVHKQIQAKALAKLQEFESKHPSGAQLSLEERLAKEDLESQIEALSTVEKKFTDVGPAYDCVVFHDGEMWRAVIDTTLAGNLEECKLLGPYCETFEYGTLTNSDMLNYAINVYDDGDLLEIVSMSTSHGTHVASIAAAHFPDEPQKNGVAPGAQIVSITISDSRIGSMETGGALIRALIKVVSAGCNVINMSYGEHAHWPRGRVLDLIHEVVAKHGIVMVSSAGNHGPALTTVGTPPVMHYPCVIGVAAYVSPDMMVAEYSLREKSLGMNYTWSSRGPAASGYLGVSICAPGGAITSVPNWLLRGSQLMNGTSMSSPHVTGALAVLLSGMKQKGLKYSPFSVRRAIENTAMNIPTSDAFSIGNGLLQVEKAFEHLTQYSEVIERDVMFHITCHGSKREHGIYLREKHKTDNPSVVNISVEPIFLNQLSVDPKHKINFQLNLSLTCDASWVYIPSFFNLMYMSRNFNVKVDPTVLPHGAHYTSIYAYDTTCPQKGPVFQIPVTVIKGQDLSKDNPELICQKVLLQPSVMHRNFIHVPAGATWAVIKIRSLHPEQTNQIVIHACQLQKHLSLKSHEFYKMVSLGPLAELTYAFQILEIQTLELCISKWWSNPGDLHIDYNISFHGLHPSIRAPVMHSVDGIFRLDLKSKLRYEELQPSISLKQHVIVLRPTDSKVSPLSSRDVVPVGRQIYELVLSYNFSLAKGTELTPTCLLLSDLLYESEYESQLWMLFDSNKQLIGCGDAYPTKYAVKLEKGDYVLKMQVRHEDRSLLSKLSDLPIIIQHKLSNAITMDIYTSYSEALIQGKKAAAVTMPPGSTVPLFVSAVPNDKLPKGCSVGNYLCGTVSFARNDLAKKVDVYPFKYIIGELPKKASSPKLPSATESEKAIEDEFAEALRDFKILWISKLQGKSEPAFNELYTANSKHVPLLLSRLQALDSDKERKKNLQSIINAADEIIEASNTTELLAAFGAKNDKKELNSNNSKQNEKLKTAVIEALSKKGIALCDLIQEKSSKCSNCTDESSLSNNKESESHKNEDLQNTLSNGDVKNNPTSENNLKIPSLADIDTVYSELQKWIDLTDSKVSSFTEKHALVHEYYGIAVKLALKSLEEKPNKENDKKCIELFRKLGWTHCIKYFEESCLVRFPADYRLF